MAIKAILFDLDGTLIDSIPLHKKSFALVFRKFGQRLSKKEIEMQIHWSTEKIYEKLRVKKRLGLSLENFLDIRRKTYYSLLRGKNIVFRERALLLKKLGKKYRLALVTNSSLMTAERSTPKSLIRLFDAIVTFSDVKNPKPAPDMLLLAAERLHEKPEDCLMIGDSVFDVIAAKAAKMPVASWHCRTAVSSLMELEKAKPTVLVKNSFELEKFLEEEHF
ncbi:MAG TPA: HAD family phosphatase [archaeon]|nr:HAD family phosphatase [archaeon]